MKRDYVGLRRRPLLTPLWLAGIAAALVVSILVWAWATADTTIVVVVRQAEAMPGSGADSLGPAGAARALQLVHLFEDRGTPGRLDAIYVSANSPSKLTAQPLAERLGLTPVIVSADPADLAHRALHDGRGGRVLIIGDRDSVPQIVSALSGGRIPPIDASDYGTIYVVTVPRLGRPNLLRLVY